MTSGQVLVVSMSEVALFNRCRKAYELGYVRNLEPIVTSEPVKQGSAFHAEMEAYAHMRRGTPGPAHIDSTDEMYAVAQEYLRLRGAEDFDRFKRIVSIEEPLYTDILPAASMIPVLKTVYDANGWYNPTIKLRTTFDLVYEKDTGWIVARDYKTFEVAPSDNYDLDFQARLYVAALMQFYGSTHVEFEFENVRRSTPGTKRGAEPAKGKPDKRPVWTEAECYIKQPLVISLAEAQATWREAQHIVANILLARALGVTDPSVWYHQALKAGPHSCNSCFYRHLCKADANGALDAETIAEFSRPRVSAGTVAQSPGIVTP